MYAKKTCGGTDLWLHAFLNSTLNCGELSASRPCGGRLARYPLNMRLPVCGPSSPKPNQTNKIQKTNSRNCILLGYYAASSGNFLPTFRDNLSVPSSGFEILNPEDGNDRLFWNAGKSCRYFSLRNNPEEHSSQLRLGGILRSRLALSPLSLNWRWV